MAQVKTEAAADDLFGIIGLLSLGQDPTQPLSAQQASEYVLLGRQYVETVLVRKRTDEVTAALALTQTRMVSAMSVMPAEPAADAPTALYPEPPDAACADAGG